MNRFLLIAVLALVAPAAALAKGASEATIEGPGLDGAIVVTGDGESLGSTLNHLAVLAGFYPAVFERSPNPMLETQPDVELGPRYVVRYVMRGPSGDSVISQDLYPYAEPYPVSYTEPGQPVPFARQDTFGGWYASTAQLKQVLMGIGLPAETPDVADGTTFAPWKIVLIVVGAAVAAALAVGIGRRRRAPAPA